jgi:hypothetical protein
MLGSVAFTVPAAFYLLTPAPTKISEHNHHGEMRMTETKNISETKEAKEAPEHEVVGPDVKPSEVDQVSNSLFSWLLFSTSNVC